MRDPAHLISLGEGLTPLVEVGPARPRALGFERGQLLLKDEGQNPTASFKARGLSAAVSRAKELGARSIALPSAGNAGAAAAAYAAAGGLEAYVAMPRDVPELNQRRSERLRRPGDPRRRPDQRRRPTRSASKRPRAAGSTSRPCASPIARKARRRWASSWPSRAAGARRVCRTSSSIPTGGGTGIVGMWKAFAELEALGLDRPAAAEDGLGPGRRLRADRARLRARRALRRAVEDAQTAAAGLRVPVGDRRLPDPGRGARQRRHRAGGERRRDHGARSSRWASWPASSPRPRPPPRGPPPSKLRQSGFLNGDERVVLFCTGMGLKVPIAPGS